MKIKVGEYVRTDNGICKIINNADKYVKDYQVSVDYIGGMYSQVINKDRILKYSKNIIDLIEVGDYVNGYKVIDIVKGFKVIVDKLELDTTTGTYKNIGIIDIKTIVTHEQFAEMEYKV